jgi:multiple sugar transport system substrate-binding protein
LKVDETLYGSAYTGKVKPGFWYKKSFFEAHNLTVPTTWAEFETLLATIDAIPGIDNPIVSGDTVGWPLSDITEHFLVAYNGSDLNLKLINGTESWTTGPAREMFEDRLVPLLEADYFSDPIDWSPDALDLWWQEDYALYFMGSWITGMVDDPDDLGVFSLPGADGLVFSADYFFIPAYTEYPDEAKELFQFLASSEAQRVQVAQGGHIATIVDIDLSEYPEVDRRVANLTTGMNVLPDLDDTIGGEFQQTFWDQLKLLWVSPASLDDVLQEIQNVAP